MVDWQRSGPAPGRYDARRALDMGLVSAVVPPDRLEEETVSRAREVPARSPRALRMLPGALNAVADGAAGLRQFAGDATPPSSVSAEPQQARDTFRERRSPDFARFPKGP